MALDRITLAHFRNHRDTQLQDTRQINILIGDNGAGKTNILEALSLLAPGRGLRRAPLEEVASTGHDGFAVGADLVPGNARLGIYTDAGRPGRRLVRINAAPATGVQLAEWLSVTWLTPAMDGLFTGTASGRRQFADRLAVALDPLHAAHASRYAAAMQERGRLLAGDAPVEAAWFDGVERLMAEHGAALARGRAALIDALNNELAAVPDGPFVRPVLTYLANGPQDAAALHAALGANRQDDLRAGRTLIGPHRDELAVTLAAKNMPAARSSTGEQKAMLIAIVLAHAGMAARGRPSVLLLDEIAAHLDPVRRVALFERLLAGQGQVWMTGTERAPFEPVAQQAAVWQVANGRVVRV
ncbi:DNA replication/repair protein RecF [Porphyrobacter sp. GA68]|uniref:DNA replication/repair protein RecF n=1 Tax=Porphyrobacter sp. GA68 TaxID=2883480 RepID=UPI001D192959|nr:DNA replication/repair protein RecF [Porphyrobacter sp. GA68]